MILLVSFFGGIFLALGIVLFWLGVKVVASNKNLYQEFYALFPELEQNTNRLEKEASFIDKKLGLAIYKGVILTYNAGMFAFSYVDLDKVESVADRYVHSNVRQTMLPPKAFLDLPLKTEGSLLVSLEIPPLVPGLHNVAGNLQRLYDAIQNEFLDINCN